jgi:hypothetical protein
MSEQISDEFDISENKEQMAPQDKLKTLHSMAGDCLSMSDAIEQMEAQLSAAKAALQSLRTEKMPELMAELSMPDFTFNGLEFKLDDFVSGSFPKDPDKRKVAVGLLKDYEAEGMIKTEITVEFGKSQHNEALDLFNSLVEKGYTASIDENIHAQTYQAFARRRLEDGEPIDAVGLGLFTGKVVKFKPVKEKKSKAKKS